MTDAKYFQTTKKGEIRELRDDLNSSNREKIKEAVKRIIAAMTVGKDVSMLFTDVIKSMGTDNIELKKLIYLYIINYARSQPEKAILVVSMFCNDVTNHSNPLIRALALRTMGCIRVDTITEYLCDPLAYALKDVDPYVRKTAAICVAKFYDLNPELVRDRGFIASLRDLLSDPNPMVVSNAVASLTEICESSGIDYFKIDNNTLSKLLTAVNHCTEWGRVFIMEALSKFEAKGPQARDICDRILPQLAHSNSAVVMGAVKIIIKFMAKLTHKKDEQKYCKKLAPPLLSLVSSPPEIQYVALRNIDLIIQKYPQIFAQDIRVFYVKYNDESYVKKQKLEILVKLATVKNVNIILQEFEHYAREIDIDFVRRSVAGIGRIAIKSGLETVSQQCVETLSKLIKTKVNYIVQECVIVIKDIFRRYPGKYEQIIGTLCDNLQDLTEPKAKASMIWIIGEYGERIIDANERLDSFTDSFESEAAAVKLQLLTASVKLFLKKPDTAKKLVQKVLHLATEASDNPDLRDRGYVYWRLLSTDPTAARKVVLAERPMITLKSINNLSKDYLSSLLNNLSTLSSVYHCKPNEFVQNTKNVCFKQWQHDSDSDSDIDAGHSDSSSSPSPSPSPSISAPLEVKQNESNDINIVADLSMAFDANKGDGLEMSIGFKTGKQMVIGCVNKGNDIITRIDIKFNKNYLGIQPTQTVPLNGDIKPGQSQIIYVPLVLLQEPVIRQPLDFNVQIAARCVRTNLLKQSKPPKIVMFASNIPAQIFLERSAVKPKQEFLCEWKSVSVRNEDIIRKIFDKNKDVNVVNIKDIFSTNSFLFITERRIQNRGVSLYFTTLLKHVTILLELSIANNEKCRMVTKSSNKYLSSIVCDVGVSLIEKQ